MTKKYDNTDPGQLSADFLDSDINLGIGQDMVIDISDGGLQMHLGNGFTLNTKTGKIGMQTVRVMNP